jgi:23S rRNA pseudouridine1911/1915/1917 synthase
MGKTKELILGDGTALSVLHEDRAVLAIDKPAGWLLAPAWWEHTGRNLQRALESSVRGDAFWAHSRHLRFLRFVHRLDADTSGVLLLARSPGALRVFSRLFQTRQVEKLYLAVVRGEPRRSEWVCELPVGRHPRQPDAMTIHGRQAREAVTHFRVLGTNVDHVLVLAKPVTGRTHQIRVHLAAEGLPIVGDQLYGQARAVGQPSWSRSRPETLACGPTRPLESPSPRPPRHGPPRTEQAGLALRAARLSYPDPFVRRPVRIDAPAGRFLLHYGFSHHLAESY